MFGICARRYFQEPEWVVEAVELAQMRGITTTLLAAVNLQYWFIVRIVMTNPNMSLLHWIRWVSSASGMIGKLTVQSIPFRPVQEEASG